jgi:menaquinol-cytochrome c reductase cytochrome b/c subunit
MSGPEPEPRYRLLGVVPREVEQQKPEQRDDGVFTCGVVVLVFVMALLFQAPLKDIANPSQTPAVAKAPWYFAGLQELLHWMQPVVAGILVPGAAVLWLFALPYLDRSKGWRIRDRKVVVVVFTLVAVAALVLTVIGTFFRGPEWTWVWPWQHLYAEF